MFSTQSIKSSIFKYPYKSGGGNSKIQTTVWLGEIKVRESIFIL